MEDKFKISDPLMVKKTLCDYYKISFKKSRLKIVKKNLFGIRGDSIQYDFILKCDGVKSRIFGKISSNNKLEYQNLQYLRKNIPETELTIPRPIALLKNGNSTLLLLEYLKGYSNSFSFIRLISLMTDSTLKITETGITLLNKIYNIQKYFQINYSALSFNDTKGIPNQPKPISVFTQLETVHSISNEIKSKIKKRITDIIQNNTIVRRGMVHGDLGIRNTMTNNTIFSFIDWECMQHQGLSLLDPCYFVIILLMRAIQLHIPQSKIDFISDSLFQQVIYLEEGITDNKYKKFIRDGLWFIKCIVLIDTIWWYESLGRYSIKAILKQRQRQINYLASKIIRETINA